MLPEKMAAPTVRMLISHEVVCGVVTEILILLYFCLLNVETENNKVRQKFTIVDRSILFASFYFKNAVYDNLKRISAIKN